MNEILKVINSSEFGYAFLIIIYMLPAVISIFRWKIGYSLIFFLWNAISNWTVIGWILNILVVMLYQTKPDTTVLTRDEAYQRYITDLYKHSKH